MVTDRVLGKTGKDTLNQRFQPPMPPERNSVTRKSETSGVPCDASVTSTYPDVLELSRITKASVQVPTSPTCACSSLSAGAKC